MLIPGVADFSYILGGNTTAIVTVTSNLMFSSIITTLIQKALKTKDTGTKWPKVDIQSINWFGPKK